MSRLTQLLAATAALLLMSSCSHPEPKVTTFPETGQTEGAVLGGGCFWCIEAVYQRLPGVKSVTSGYAGGHVANPTYQQVCTGETGHAEVARIEFDPAVLSYG